MSTPTNPTPAGPPNSNPGDPAAPAPTGQPGGSNPEPQSPTPSAPSSEPAPTEPQLDPAIQAALDDPKILENSALWNHPRLKGLREAKTRVEQLEQQQREAHEAQLTKEKQFEQLAEERKTENEKLQDQIKSLNINQAVTAKLTPLGVVDIEAALQLIDKSQITVNKDGSVTGVEQAVEALKTEKAYLFNPSQQQPIGSPPGGAQGQPQGTMKFKRSQLQDPTFYQEHRDDILKAAQAGLIEDDLS